MRTLGRASLPRHRRRATIYLAVLSYAILVTIIAMAALLALRVQRKAADGEIDLNQARIHAHSAIQLGMWVIKNDPNWRTTFTNGPWVEDRPIRTGRYSLEGIDPNDYDLANSAYHPLVLTGTGSEGVARHKTRVRLEAERKPLGCLEVSLHAENDLKFNAALLQSDQTISANNAIDSISSTIDANAEAVNAISGTGYTGTSTTGVDPRSMPTSAVFDYYLARGTPISILSMPSNVSGVRMSQVVLSPVHNPFGEDTNSEGIYTIDCQGTNIDIKLSRIIGTLVLKNPGSDSIIRQSVNWKPAIKNYPALMVSGSMSISLDAADLSESALGVNFNPPGTFDEYEGDSDLDDTYSSKIKGIVYVSGDLAASMSNTFEGVVVVGGTLSTTGTMDLEYKSRHLDNPPPGFIEVSGMRVVAGSWQQVVD